MDSLGTAGLASVVRRTIGNFIVFLNLGICGKLLTICLVMRWNFGDSFLFRKLLLESSDCWMWASSNENRVVGASSMEAFVCNLQMSGAGEWAGVGQVIGDVGTDGVLKLFVSSLFGCGSGLLLPTKITDAKLSSSMLVSLVKLFSFDESEIVNGKSDHFEEVLNLLDVSKQCNPSRRESADFLHF